MADRSRIEWTDATWNPITGCSRVSTGCVNCYAETLAATRLKYHPSRRGLTDEHGRWNGVVQLNKQWLRQPLDWRKPRRVFVVAHGDLFHSKVPEDWIVQVFAVMSAAPWHTFQVLTKRPSRMHELLNSPDFKLAVWLKRSRMEGVKKSTYLDNAWPLENVWAGVSCENQRTFDQRWPLLAQTSAAVRWLSLEPLLGPIGVRRALPECVCGDMRVHHPDDGPCVFNSRRDLTHGFQDCNKFRPVWEGEPADWIVVGGESGRGYRPMKPIWAEGIRIQCRDAQVPFFLKQMAGKKEIPDHLMVREWPRQDISNRGEEIGEVVLDEYPDGILGKWPKDVEGIDVAE